MYNYTQDESPGLPRPPSDRGQTGPILCEMPQSLLLVVVGISFQNVIVPLSNGCSLIVAVLRSIYLSEELHEGE